jgi:hypothetical protein
MSQVGAIVDLTAAAGGGLANAAQITTSYPVVRVTTVASANDSVKLPVCNAGLKFTVRNNGANSCNVFPPNTNSAINSLGVGNAYPLVVGASVDFICVPNSALTTDANGIGVQFNTVSSGLAQPIVLSPAANTALSASQTGSVIVALDNAAATTITLPAVSPGLNYTFVAKAKAIGNKNTWKVDCGAGLLDGNYIDATPQCVNKSAGQYVNFIANTYLAGDYCQIVCDGTHWKAFSVSGAAGGITMT